MSEALDLTDLSSIDEIENEWIAMPDGARLAARIWKPKDADRNPVPAILEYIPYRKRDFMRSRDEPMHRYFALHGYASVRVDMRGSGDSDGVLDDEYSPAEHDDALAIIAWIARATLVFRCGRHDWDFLGRLQCAAGRGAAIRRR